MPVQWRWVTAHDCHPKIFAYQSPPQQAPRGDDYPAIAAPSVGRDQLIRNTHRPESILRADGAVSFLRLWDSDGPNRQHEWGSLLRRSARRRAQLPRRQICQGFHPCLGVPTEGGQRCRAAEAPVSGYRRGGDAACRHRRTIRTPTTQKCERQRTVRRSSRAGHKRLRSCLSDKYWDQTLARAHQRWSARTPKQTPMTSSDSSRRFPPSLHTSSQATNERAQACAARRR